jgi:predicted unusual protein kinase regulating ubiquinone biosynthesis (AarF/ABC1/UbiB family)
VVGWFKRYRAIARRANLDALVNEFSRVLWQEIDYQQEAEHARRFGEMFASEEGIRIPQVYDELSTKRVLTLEDVYFIKVTDYAAIETSGVDRRQVADRLFHTYLHQIFEEGFFHADPHPGNLFVEPLGDNRWRLVFVDFGMVGHLSTQAKEALREVAIAVGTRDADRMIRGYQMLGVLLPGADLERVRQAEIAIFDRFWGKSMREMMRMDLREAHEFMHQFRDLLYELPFQLPSDLVYLGRCVAILSGMCTGLDRDFNLFEGLAPFARQLVAEESRPWVEALLQVLATQGRALISLPARLDSALDRVDRGTLMVTARAAPELERQVAGLTRAINRLVAAVVFLALLVVGALLLISGNTLFGGIGLALALVALMWILVGQAHH